jgi:thioredoxin reductase (NADPH)
MENIYDVIIVGSGAGGLTAALYSARYARKTAVISGSFGGITAKAGDIENWSGIKKIHGLELMNQFKEHVSEYDVDFVEGYVQTIEKKDGLFVVDLGDNTMTSKTVILSLGTKTRELGVPGEEEFKAKGVSYCATCDGMFFKDKEVVVVGGADSACKAAVYLGDICKKVTVVYRKDKLRGEGVYVKKIEERDNTEVIYNSNPVRINGENSVTGIVIKDNDGNESEIPVNGVFVEIGADPETKIAKEMGMELDESGYVKTKPDMSTNVAGAYAVGDMRNTPMRQIVTAASDGAIAANSAHEYLNKQH